MSAGGKRKGAGRKPLPADQRAVAITMRVRPAIAQRFADLRRAHGLSQSRAFAELVQRSPAQF